MMCHQFSVSQMYAYILGKHLLFNDCRQDLDENYILNGAEENNYLLMSNVSAQVLCALCFLSMLVSFKLMLNFHFVSPCPVSCTRQSYLSS